MMTAIMGGFRTIISLLSDLATFIWLLLRPQGTLAAENLFLRKQLAMYQRRNLKPRWPNTSFCIALAPESEPAIAPKDGAPTEC